MNEENSDSLYEALGGEEPIRKICDRFYDFMESLPEAATILALHPSDLSSSRDKFYLSGDKNPLQWRNLIILQL